MTITQQQLRDLMHYCPESGSFARRVNDGLSPIGGSTDTYGYKQVRVDGKKYLAHRLAWLYVYGIWPTEQVDHRNGQRSDNRIKNLRIASHAENQQNKREPHGITKSGVLGVTWDAKARKWQARISLNRKRTSLGFFASIAEAAEAYRAAKRQLHSFCTI